MSPSVSSLWRPLATPGSRRRSGTLAVIFVTVCVLLVGVSAEAKRRNVIGDVSVSQESDGTTVVRVTGSGTIRERDSSWYHIIQTPPRAVVRLRGVEAPDTASEIPVGDGNVERITVSHNPAVDPPELSLVFELSSYDVRISEISAEGRQLVVRLTGGAAPRPPAPAPFATPSPTGTAPLPPVATPTATPRRTATPAPTRQPTLPPTAAPGPQPSPTARARTERTRGSKRAPAAPSTSRPPEPKTLYRAPSTTEARTPAAPGSRPSTVVSTIAEVVAAGRPDGSALLRITLADPIGTRRVRHRRDPMDPLRHQFVIQGLEIASAPAFIAAEVASLGGLELTQLQEEATPEMQITLRLSSEQVVVGRVALQGPHLVIVLEPPPPP